MESRARTAVKQLKEIADVLPASAAAEALKIRPTLGTKNRAVLEKAADEVRAIGKRFGAAHAGPTLAALDPVIRGEPVVVAAAPEPPPAAPAATKTAAKTSTKEAPAKPPVNTPAPTPSNTSPADRKSV